MEDDVYAVGPVGTGTVSGSSGSSNVTGSGTYFLTQYQDGDQICILGAGGACYDVESVTDNTHLVLDGTLSTNYSGAEHHGLREAAEFLPETMPPRSVPSEGERVRTGSGVSVFVGYPTVEWKIDGISVANYTALRSYVLGGGFSGLCYVQTRDMDDSWAIWRAIVDLPTATDAERWGVHYLSLVVSFILIEEE